MSKMRLPPSDNGPGQSAKILPFRPVAVAEVVAVAGEQQIEAPKADSYQPVSGPASLPAANQGLVTPVTRPHPLLMSGILANGQAIAMTSNSVKPVVVDGKPTIQGDVELNSRTALRAFSADVEVVTGHVSVSELGNVNNVDLLKLSGLQHVGGRFEVEGL